MINLFIASEMFFPKDNGGKIAAYNYFRKLHTRNTILIAFYDKTKTKKDIIKDKCISEFNIKDVKLIPFHIRIRKNIPMLIRTLVFIIIKKYPYLLAKFYSRSMIKTVLDIVKKEDIDTVYINGLNLLYLARLIKKIKPAVRIIQISHNNESEIAENYSKNKNNPLFIRSAARIEALLINHYLKREIKSAEKIYCISSIDAKRLNEKLKTGKFEYCPMPYFFNRPYKYKKPEFPFVGICCSLTWPPNIEGLLWYVDKIHPVLIKEIPDYQLLVGGAHAGKDIEKKLTNTGGVQYLGYVDDLQSFYDRCAIIAVPLLSGSGIRIKILDAFSFSKPVVATKKAVQGLNLTTQKELIYEEAELGFSNSIIKLINNLAFQQELARNGYNYLQRGHI